MNTKILGLTEENLAEAPEWEAHPRSCKYCLYWEHPELCLDPAAGVREERFAKNLPGYEESEMNGAAAVNFFLSEMNQWAMPSTPRRNSSLEPWNTPRVP